MQIRIGNGYDSHTFVSGRNLILGGVNIPHDKGLLGHSDADAVIHALIDSIFGALALGDIGTHFPDTDPNYKNISSIIILEETILIMKSKGFSIGNIDISIICEKPKLRNYIDEMRRTLSSIIEINIDDISIKAKTNEGMDAVGHGEGVAVYASILLYKK